MDSLGYIYCSSEPYNCRDAEFGLSARRPVGELGNMVISRTPVEIVDGFGICPNKRMKIYLIFFGPCFNISYLLGLGSPILLIITFC
jgi:hypothetical protein